MSRKKDTQFIADKFPTVDDKAMISTLEQTYAKEEKGDRKKMQNFVKQLKEKFEQGK